MKKLNLLFLSATLLVAACSPANQSNDTAAPAPAATPAAETPAAPATTETVVNYACTHENKKVGVTATYTVQGNDVTAVKIASEGTEYPMLQRDPANKEDNQFTDGKYTWVTELANADELAVKAGNMMTEKAMSNVNGENIETDNIIFKYCEVHVEPTPEN